MAPKLTPNLDCCDLDVMSDFWCGALDYALVGGAGQYRLIRPRSGEGLPLRLQLVPEGKTAKNRLHLDVDHEPGFDVEAEANRLVALGASMLSGVLEENGWRWVVMADPEGNEFCVCAQ